MEPEDPISAASIIATGVGKSTRSKHRIFLIRWRSGQARQHARQRVREIPARQQLPLPVDEIVGDLNPIPRRVRGYFRSGKLRPGL
jgi:RNA-directed DNA polymerase